MAHAVELAAAAFNLSIDEIGEFGSVGPAVTPPAGAGYAAPAVYAPCSGRRIRRAGSW